MKFLNIKYLAIKPLKMFVLALILIPSMGICSFETWADLPLSEPKGCELSHPATGISEALLTGDCILLIGFVLWIAYIIFFSPKTTLKKS